MAAQKDPGAQPSATSSQSRIPTGFRFSPHVLVFGLTAVAVFYAAQGAFISFTYAWHDKSYRQVEFVMDEWRPNEGYPYVKGHLANTTEDAPFHLPGAVVDGKRVLAEAPAIPYVAGTVVPTWYSPDATLSGYNDEHANGVPVAAVPERPGWGKFLMHVVFTLVVAVVGFLLMVWVASRFSVRT
jgi:hypothetical protein